MSTGPGFDFGGLTSPTRRTSPTRLRHGTRKHPRRTPSPPSRSSEVAAPPSTLLNKRCRISRVPDLAEAAPWSDLVEKLPIVLNLMSALRESRYRRPSAAPEGRSGPAEYTPFRHRMGRQQKSPRNGCQDGAAPDDPLSTPPLGDRCFVKTLEARSSGPVGSSNRQRPRALVQQALPERPPRMGGPQA